MRPGRGGSGCLDRESGESLNEYSSQIQSAIVAAVYETAQARCSEGLWLRCGGCSATVFRNQVEENLNVCPECDHHFHVPTSVRLKQLLDPDSFEEWYDDLSPVDPLGFADRMAYADRLQAEQSRTGMKDACTVGRGYMRGRPLVFGMTDSSFIDMTRLVLYRPEKTHEGEEGSSLLSAPIASNSRINHHPLALLS